MLAHPTNPDLTLNLPHLEEKNSTYNRGGTK